MRIGHQEFDTQQHTYIMGILNITPDSFSDGGHYHQIDQALLRTETMIKEGADILDIGGESTRPGYQMISSEEEILRVVPVIEAIKARFDIPISLDTYKSQVALAGIMAGADMINDIWGLKYDSEMAGVISKYKAACCLMHNKKESVYTQFLKELCLELQESIDLAKAAGIEEQRICIDPGVGFAKSYHQNLEVLKHLEDLKDLNYPVLLGTSKKSVIGLTLDLPVDQRQEGTLVTTVMAVMAGCGFVRVHEIEANKRAILMTEAILHS